MAWLKRFITFTAAVAITLGNGVLASADSRGITFETPLYVVGSINGQQGWGGQNPPGIPINPLIDQAIVMHWPNAPASFGAQSWRISNAYTSGTFGDMPFSPSLANEAGETQALNSYLGLQFSGGTRQNHFEAQWAFASADPTGPGTDCSTTNLTCSYLSISPDRGDGARMSYIRLEDDAAGLNVFFDDYQDVKPYGSLANPAAGCDSSTDLFVETQVASLDRTKAHTVKLTMDFVEGPRNDVVKVYVDGTLRHTGTSWEDYFRWCTESHGGIPNDSMDDQSRTVDSLLFRVGGGQLYPSNMGKGFLIDNVFYSSSMSEQECDTHRGDGEGDVHDGSGGTSHARFHKDGCDKRDGDSVEHDDAQHGHSFQSTSVDSSQVSTAADGRTLTMTGTGLDNGQPVGFTMVSVDHDGLIPATYSLILTDGYSFIGSFATGSVSIQ